MIIIIQLILLNIILLCGRGRSHKDKLQRLVKLGDLDAICWIQAQISSAGKRFDL